MRLAVIDRENAQTDVIAKNRVINRLRDELSGRRTNDPDAEQVRMLLSYWKVALGKRKTTAVPLDGARAQKVRWALRIYDEQRLCKAIDGCARWPYQGPYGRRSRVQKDAFKLDDDIRKICRDEQTFEKFETLGMCPVEIMLERKRLWVLDQIRQHNICDVCDALDITVNELLDVRRQARAA